MTVVCVFTSDRKWQVSHNLVSAKMFFKWKSNRAGSQVEFPWTHIKDIWHTAPGCTNHRGLSLLVKTEPGRRRSKKIIIIINIEISGCTSQTSVLNQISFNRARIHCN